MKTVQRSASCTGAGEASATASNSPTMSTPSLAASSCRKLPVPAAQTLFMSKSTACRSSRRMYLASCPPISKIVSTSGSAAIAPRACAVISSMTRSAARKSPTTCRPEPVVARPSSRTPPPRSARSPATSSRATSIGRPRVGT